MLKGNSDKKVETTEADFDDFWLNFLSKFKAIFNTALAHESGSSGGLFDEKKNEGWKSCDTL
jgi:hypothetical protein